MLNFFSRFDETILFSIPNKFLFHEIEQRIF